MIVTRTGETAPDTVQNLPNDGAMGAQFGAPFGQGYFNFFQKLMAGVTDMTAAQNALIKNKSGAFDAEVAHPQRRLGDLRPERLTGPGSYLAVGSCCSGRLHQSPDVRASRTVATSAG